MLRRTYICMAHPEQVRPVWFTDPPQPDCPRFVTRSVLYGAMNGASFLAYVEQMLAPTLAEGDIVLLNNLSSHRVSGVR